MNLNVSYLLLRICGFTLEDHRRHSLARLSHRDPLTIGHRGHREHRGKILKK